MKYSMTTPCDACPFLRSMAHGFSMRRLREFASGEFPCHKTAKLNDDDLDGRYEATENSVHCAGALIFNEKRERPHQMMRICERLGMYDASKLDMRANVR
jgi:hypothetical protein